jgi:Protein of unknown function (DUF2934)
MATRTRRTRRTDVPVINEEMVTDGAVAQRAYELFVSRGGTHGHDFDDWIQAKRELVREPDEATKLG